LCCLLILVVYAGCGLRGLMFESVLGEGLCGK
jgi:hypothetical protein